MKTFQRYWVEMETFEGGLKRVAAPSGDYCLADEVESYLERQDIVLKQLRDDKQDHERFVGRLKRLMEAELFDDAAGEIRAEYESIHGPRD